MGNRGLFLVYCERCAYFVARSARTFSDWHTLHFVKKSSRRDAMPDATGADIEAYGEDAKVAIWIHEGKSHRNSDGKWFVVRYSGVLVRAFHACFTTLALTLDLRTGRD